MLLRQMEYFLAVVDCGNFYEAGERCHVSQSAISQQIKKLEEELGVQLLDRHNRTFSLTPAGENFYRKSLVISGDIAQMIREVKRLDRKAETLHLGYFHGYHGAEFSAAVAQFSEQFPSIDIEVTIGGHDELFHGMEAGILDLVVNDQRRAFSSAYNNVVLARSRSYVDVSALSPLGKLQTITLENLKNTPCISVASADAQAEERRYHEDLLGIKGKVLFASSVQEARLMVVARQGYLLTDVLVETNADTSDSLDIFATPPVNSPAPSIARVPLVREGNFFEKNYCAFWRKGNTKPSIETFAKLLKTEFG